MPIETAAAPIGNSPCGPPGPDSNLSFRQNSRRFTLDCVSGSQVSAKPSAVLRGLDSPYNLTLPHLHLSLSLGLSFGARTELRWAELDWPEGVRAPPTRLRNHGFEVLGIPGQSIPVNLVLLKPAVIPDAQVWPLPPDGKLFARFRFAPSDGLHGLPRRRAYLPGTSRPARLNNSRREVKCASEIPSIERPKTLGPCPAVAPPGPTPRINGETYQGPSSP